MFKKAGISDLDFLYSLETSTFSQSFQSSKRSIKNSLFSASQDVIILWINEKAIGSYTLLFYKRIIRIYSLAILKEYTGQGFGKIMMNHIIEKAKSHQKDLILEFDANNVKLKSFYESFGFERQAIMMDYYGENNHAIKMKKKVNSNVSAANHLIVVDQEIDWLKEIENVTLIKTNDYIEHDQYANYKGKIYNLCQSYKFQSTGYYVSLLASARDQNIIPNVTTITDFKSRKIQKSISEEIDDLIQEYLKKITFEKISLRIFFGYTKVSSLSVLAKELFSLFESPLIEVEFMKRDKWILNHVIPLSTSKIYPEEIPFVSQAAAKYFKKRASNQRQLRNYTYDLAILVDPTESTPPSSQKSLELFKKAANEIGFYTEFITKKDYHRLNEFDALFIRATTNVNDYTYDFSRFAYSEGLVVLDDPWSIVKCSNKIFLYEKLLKNNVPMPYTKVLNQHTFKAQSFKNLSFPIIIKEPSSSFSKGVFKVHTIEELGIKVKDLFKKSQLLILQEFIQSEYDWRIGILDNKVIYACKYYMAKNHWQIYDWDISADGDSDTFAISDVPADIIELSLKATSLIGRGLYGVDLKYVDNKIYIIEINDNPSIDYGYEDAVEGFSLYQTIMNYLFTNIDQERNSIRYVSNSK